MMSPAPPMRPSSARALVVFLVLAVGLAWLVALPLWLHRPLLTTPLFGVMSIAMMMTPATAAFVAVRVVDGDRAVGWRLGLALPKPGRRLLGFLALAVLMPLLVVVAGLLIAWVAGVYHVDLRHYSAFRELLDAQLSSSLQGVPDAPTSVDDLPVPVWVLAWLQVGGIVAASLVNTLPALGEEVGWRGFLFEALSERWGTGVAVVLGGIIWGLWHSPLVLLGYNYPSVAPWQGVAMMVVTSTLLGVMLAWLRQRSATVWTAALAHGAVNASAGLAVVLGSADRPFSTVHVTVLGWTGWLPLAALAVWVLATGRLVRWSPPRWLIPSR